MFTYWKRALGALFLFLTSCMAPNSPWEYGWMDSSCQSFRSQRLLLPADNLFRGMSLELTQTQSGLNAYLNIYSLSFPKNPANPSYIQVNMTVEKESWVFLAIRLEGGQRALLPQEACNLLIDQLLQGKEVFLSVEKYHTAASPIGFSKLFKKFNIQKPL